MKNTIRLIMVLAVTAATLMPVETSPFKARISSTTLDNGLKVIVQEDHSTDLVAVDVWVRAGSINETDKTNGVSHFLEHLLFKATKSYEPGQVDMEIESLGASLEARTSRDWAHFYTVVAQQYLDKSLHILAEVVGSPKFEPADIEHERKVIIDEIVRRESNPFDILRDTVFRTAYTIHPYSLPVEGTRESIRQITRDTIVNYHSNLYVPENMAVIMVGDVTPEEGIAAVRQAFAGLEKKTVKRMEIPAEPAHTEQIRLVVKRDTRLSYIGIAFPAPSVKDRPDVHVMDVLMSYLGVGYQSWLATELKNGKRLAVEASSDFLTQRDRGLAIILVSAEPDKAADAEEAVFVKIEELKNNLISEQDLARAKRSLESGYAFDMETFTGRATTLGFYTAIDSFEFARTYIQNIRKVTADDVLALAKKYFDPNQSVVVTLGP